MSDLSIALGVTAGALKTQAARLRHVAENISNADTPGYHRKMISFRTETDGEGVTRVRPGDLQLDRSDLRSIYDPAHPLADDTGHYDGSNVDVMIEIADAREAQRSYEANLKMFDQTRQMSSALMELLRKQSAVKPGETRMDLNAISAARGYAQARPATEPGQTPAATTPVEALRAAATDFADTLAKGEAMAQAAMTGDADPHSLVHALAQTELAVETAMTVRDKVVEAYQEILRMPV